MDWKFDRQESEAAYFKKITPDLSPAEMLNAVTRWRARVGDDTFTMKEWAEQRSHPNHSELVQQIESLQRAGGFERRFLVG